MAEPPGGGRGGRSDKVNYTRRGTFSLRWRKRVCRVPAPRVAAPRVDKFLERQAGARLAYADWPAPAEAGAARPTKPKNKYEPAERRAARLSGRAAANRSSNILR